MQSLYINIMIHYETINMNIRYNIFKTLMIKLLNKLSKLPLKHNSNL